MEYDILLSSVFPLWWFCEAYSDAIITYIGCYAHQSIIKVNELYSKRQFNLVMQVKMAQSRNRKHEKKS